MKLYNSVGPNPHVVRMFMAERGIDLPKEDIDLMAGENRQAPYTTKNPAGQLPALELDDGSILTEITAICEYLDETQPGDRVANHADEVLPGQDDGGDSPAFDTSGNTAACCRASASGGVPDDHRIDAARHQHPADDLGQAEALGQGQRLPVIGLTADPALAGQRFFDAEKTVRAARSRPIFLSIRSWQSRG